MSIKTKVNFFDTLLYLPLISFFTVFFFIYGWDKKVVVLFVVAIIAILFKYGLKPIKENYKEPYIIIMGIATIYGSTLYNTIGYGSSEIRALIASTVFLLFFPKEKITVKGLPILLLISAIISLAFMLYARLYLNLPRGYYFFNPIPYAITLCIFAVMSLYYFLQSKHKILLVAYFLFSTSIFITETRGAIIPLILSTLLLLVLLAIEKGKFKKIFFSSALGVIVTLAFSYNFVNARINDTIQEIHSITEGNYNTSIGLRLQMWQASPELISINPIFGLGDSHKQELQNLYQEGKVHKSLADFEPSHYHNQYIDKVVKSGAIGFLIFILVTYYPAFRCFVNRKRESNDNAILIYLIAITFGFSCLTDTPFSQSFTLFPLLLGNYFFLISGYKKD